jgi:toxin ParE1/3/4
MGRPILSPRSKRDVDEIWNYSVHHWGTDRAKLYMRDIRKVIEAVADDPARGYPCEEIRAGYFKISAGSHIVFYRRAGADVRILRILHQRMDFRRHL